MKSDYDEAMDRAQQQLLQAQVVVFCSVSMTDRSLTHHITEIWRNNSDGLFTNATGDTITEVLHPQQGPPSAYGQHSLLYFATEDGVLGDHGTYFLHNNRFSFLHDMTKEEAHRLLTE